MSRRRKSNHKGNQRGGRVDSPRTFRSLSASSFVMGLVTADEEFSQFISQCVSDHEQQFGRAQPGSESRVESHHRLPGGFPCPPKGEPGHIEEVVVLTDTTTARVTTVVLFDIEYDHLEQRDGSVRSFAEVGLASDDGPTMTISEV